MIQRQINVISLAAFSLPVLSVARAGCGVEGGTAYGEVALQVLLPLG